jgi:hypothetical protein
MGSDRLANCFQTGLAGAYRIRIIVGFTILATSWAAVILTTLLACQPFQGYFNTTDMKVSSKCQCLFLDDT